ncbi:hypothetical protein HDN1F_24900 [gamma proteobacterium HdN1]|nr:hypothetical protein HDN1F_24900 [gamma proteobacterium HdN1]
MQLIRYFRRIPKTASSVILPIDDLINRLIIDPRAPINTNALLFVAPFTGIQPSTPRSIRTVQSSASCTKLCILHNTQYPAQ